MSEITAAAEELKEAIESAGAFPKAEVKSFAMERGVDEKQWGLVVGHGAGPNRGWWHTEGDMLVPGPKASVNGNTPKTPPKDPLTLDTPREKFVSVMANLGIAPKIAESVGFYIDSNFNINDPDNLAIALQQVSEIMPAQKARLLTTWTSFIGGQITPELMKKAKELGAASPLHGSDNGSGPDEKAPRRFVAFKGQVLPVDPGDEGGMTFAEALQMANLQFGQMGTQNGTGDAMTAVIHEMGETSRATMEVLSRDNPPAAPAPVQDNTDLLLKFVEARMDTERVRSEAMVERMMEQHGTQMDKMSEVLGQLANGYSQRKSPFGELDDLIPGFGKKLLDRILDPPEAAPQGYKINVPGLNGSNGAEAEVSLDAYERIKGMEQKDAMIALAKTQMPEFLRIGEKIAKSITLASKEENEPEAPEQEAIGQVTCANPSCKIQIGFYLSQTAFNCPGCGAVHNQAGQWLNEPVARQQPAASVDLEHEQLEEPGQETAPAQAPEGATEAAPPEDPPDSETPEAAPEEPEVEEAPSEEPATEESVEVERETVPA